MSGGVVRIGDYHRGLPVAALPEGWNAQYDGSLRSGGGKCGVEFVSPVLKGAEGMAQVKAVLAQLKAWGATVNESCGLHVHVGFAVSQKNELKRLVAMAANYEKAIYAATGTKSRERGNYCRSVRQNYSVNELNQPVTNWRSMGGTNRYHLLNVQKLRTGGHMVEFRAFADTLNFVKVAGYIRLVLGMVEKAAVAKRRNVWALKPVVATSPVARKGLGQTELTRLFYGLGWTAGRTKCVYGAVAGDGLPSLKACKKQLMNLAKKYDSRP